MAEIKIKGDISGSTTIKAPDSGSDEVIELSTVLDGKAPLNSPTFTGTVALPSGTTLDGSALTSGKILQIVRATDGSSRSTTSTSFVDVTGVTVTITPTKSDSALILIAAFSFAVSISPSGNNLARVQITDSSNNIVSGGGEFRLQANPTANLYNPTTLIAYATPATTSPVTYKLRFKVDGTSTAFIEGNLATSQMYAIEVAA